jgi:hypothetical protein
MKMLQGWRVACSLAYAEQMIDGESDEQECLQAWQWFLMRVGTFAQAFLFLCFAELSPLLG